MNRQNLTPGKVRRLQTAADAAGVFRILAIDHRGVLLRMMDPEGRGQVPAERVTQLKLDVVGRIGPLASAVILDPEYGALQAIACGALGGNVGLLIPLDSNHHPGHAAESNGGRPAWSVKQAQAIGASGVKLYLSYHPDAGDRTLAQEDLVREVVQQCARRGDSAVFGAGGLLDRSRRSERFARLRARAKAHRAENGGALGALGPDVLKLQFPVDARHESSEAVWRGLRRAERCGTGPLGIAVGGRSVRSVQDAIANRLRGRRLGLYGRPRAVGRGRHDTPARSRLPPRKDNPAAHGGAESNCQSLCPELAGEVSVGCARAEIALRAVFSPTCPEASPEIANMARGDQDDDAVYVVVVNHEEQYSIWPLDRAIPLGWNSIGKTGCRDECLAYIESVWTDMRPLSLRPAKETEGPETPNPQETRTAGDREQYEQGPSLVERLSSGQHPVEAALRPERSAAALRECIDRECLHIRFVQTYGPTELCMNLDKATSVLHLADFENAKGVVHLEGELTLNGIWVRCIVDLDLATLCGNGHLVPLVDRSPAAAREPR